MAVLKGYAGKRTEGQRRNDVAQKVRPKDTQDITYVTIGLTIGKADKRDDDPVPPAQEEIPITIASSKPADGIIDDAGNRSGAKY